MLGSTKVKSVSAKAFLSLQDNMHDIFWEKYKSKQVHVCVYII